MLTITYEQAKLALAAAVKSKGEGYVYPDELRDYSDAVGADAGACQYVANGEPACIVGVALDWLDIDVSKLVNIDIRNAAPNAGIDITKRGMALFEEAQGLQDRGMAWGLAVRRALTEVEQTHGE